MKVLIVAAFTALVALYSAASWIGAGWLLMPPREPLQHELVRPGLRIDRGVTPAGTPYLLCRPDTTSGPGPRGKILRSQLARKIATLRAYSEQSGTVVLLHGWGMRKEDLLSTAERFCAAGLRCVIPDLPGHGDNLAPIAGFGARESDRDVPGDVLTAAARQFHFAAQPVGLWGISMGGAYALQAADAQPERWSAVIVVSSFDRLDAVVKQAVDTRSSPVLETILGPGIVLAVRLRGGFWLGDDWSLRHAARLKCPVLVVHGETDDLIPIAQGRRLYEAVPHHRKAWIAVVDALHGNVLGTPQHVFVEMAAWYLQWLPNASKSPRA